MRLYGLQKLISDLPPIPSYSLFNIDNLQRRGNVNQPNYTIVLEWDYRIQLNELGFTFSPSYNTSSSQTEQVQYKMRRSSALPTPSPSSPDARQRPTDGSFLMHLW